MVTFASKVGGIDASVAEMQRTFSRCKETAQEHSETAAKRRKKTPGSASVVQENLNIVVSQ